MALNKYTALNIFIDIIKILIISTKYGKLNHEVQRNTL